MTASAPMVLHHVPSTAAMAPHILLLETGAPFRLQRVDTAAGEHRLPAYLRLNPNASVPVLEHGSLVLYESAAICLHLAESFPAAGLMPALGTAERAHAHKWLFWLTNTLQATLMSYFYPERWVRPGHAAGAAEVKAQAEQRVGGMIDQLEAALAAQGTPWLLGPHYRAVDAYALMLCRWTRHFERPARTLPALGPYLARGLARPATRAVFEREGIEAPWV